MNTHVRSANQAVCHAGAPPELAARHVRPVPPGWAPAATGAGMRATYYDHNGPAQEVLVVGELRDPEPGAGEVHVRVEASGVHPADVKRRSGIGGRIMRASRVIPGDNGAGIIDRVGPRAGRLSWCARSHRSRCTFADGPVDGLTVLVAGGASAVAHYAIEFARHGGAGVIATASTSGKQQAARNAGANVVIDYRRADAANPILDVADPSGVHRVVDVAFGANLPLTSTVVATNGRHRQLRLRRRPRTDPSILFAHAPRRHDPHYFCICHAGRRYACRNRGRHEASVGPSPHASDCSSIPPRGDRGSREHVENGRRIGKVLVTSSS